MTSFPPRGRFAISVRSDADGWLMLTPRGHGWLRNDQDEAIRDAEFVAGTFGVAVWVIP